LIVLGIETSCDETSASVLKSPRRILSNVISSQMELHHAYGGVVPELASRRHVEVIDEVVKESLTQAGISLEDIDLIAVTAGPGLIGALLIGMTFAKSLAYALGKPLMGINHLESHLYAPLLENPQMQFPFVSLIVSGGHTLLVWVKDVGEYEILGSTFDDAAGEAFDKIGKLLGLGYPGGPVIDRLAKSGNPKAYRFPRPMLSSCKSLDFSFSGLKTAILYLVKGYGAHRLEPAVWKAGKMEDLAASFQQAVVDVLVEKCVRALRQTGAASLAIGGGVAANSQLRSDLEKASVQHGFALFLPSKIMCTDNAGMVAGLACARAMAGLGGEPLEANPRLHL
jgi:N6-L-threonylcarbamoyladenine synthase